MGDKYSEGNITVIYTPKDNYYKNADDKIVELAEKFCNEFKEDLTVITDDLGIIKKTEETGSKLGRKIIIQGAKNFAVRLEKLLDGNALSEDLERKSLSSREEKEINDELLEIWK